MPWRILLRVCKITPEPRREIASAFPKLNNIGFCAPPRRNLLRCSFRVRTRTIGAIMARLRLEQAYPGIEFRPRAPGWFARITRVPPEWVRLETQQDWMASFAPDTLYLRGKKAARRPGAWRPEVSLCRACLFGLLGPELEKFRGRVAAFEPDSASVSQ